MSKGHCSVLVFGLVLAVSHAADRAPSPFGPMTLDDQHPQSCTAIARKLLPLDAEVLTVIVAGVENPRRGPVTIAVSLETTTAQHEIARFTLYPPDQPGTFRFRLDGTARQLLAAKTPPQFCSRLMEQQGGDDDRTAVRRVRLGDPRFERAD